MNLLAIMLQQAEPEAPGIFDLNIGVSVWTVVLFLLLLWLLSKFAFPHILGYARAREERIQQALDAARRDREESARLLEQQRQQLAEARQQGQQVIGEARQAAERVRQELLDRARQEQDQLLARAREEIERERERAVDALRREAVELSLAAASRLLGRRLDEETDRQLVREYLEQAGAKAAAGNGAGVA